jgi:hypothetical protein
MPLSSSDTSQNVMVRKHRTREEVVQGNAQRIHDLGGYLGPRQPR